ncbi:MAB_1171c family putative transporter [Streptomyces sp. URMC 123]|uniref:MAB_1171c family putative transporter n=1 Tax=Streptomyces sp. URMC 123 TaxID=3423403 RepID=UPI003F1DCA6B
MSDAIYLLPASATAIAFCCKVPTLFRAPRNPLLRSVCAVLLLSTCTFFFASPSIIGVVNRVSGVANFSVPLVYVLVCGLSAASLVLVVHWRGGSARRRRRVARGWMVGYTLIGLALITLFALGDAPQERRVDFDTYYATTPFMRELIVLYLLGQAAATVAVMILCLRWSRQVAPGSWLRRGLRVLQCGFLLSFGFDAAKLIAVGARWAQTDWDALNTSVAPMVAAIASLFVSTGFLLPLIGDRLSVAADRASGLRTLVVLKPLWQEMRAAAPSIVAPVPVPWWAIELRLTRRIAEIHDGRLALRPYGGADAADAAYARALRAGMPEIEAEAIAEAAGLVAAARNKAAGSAPRGTEAVAPSRSSTRLERTTLVRVSRALRSPLVAAARTSSQETTVHEATP